MSSDVTEKLQAAFRCFQAQDLTGAERLCAEILREAPRHPDGMHLLGVVRLAAGKAHEAASLIAAALEGNAGDTAMLEHLGVARLALRDYFAAETTFRQALAQGATHGQLYMRLGIALASQGKVTEAVTALREAAVKSPADPDVLLNLGNTLAEQGETEEASACYHRLLALQPHHAVARFNLGTLYRNMGRLEAAAAAFKQALAVAPDDPDTHNNLGLVYEQQQRLEDAAGCFRRALALNPDHVHARNNLGNVLRAQGRLDEAVACYEKVLADAPNQVDAYINLGAARAEQGGYPEAHALYEQALRRDPRSFEAHYNLGKLLALQGVLMDAIGHYRQAVEVGPRQAIAHSELGNAYRQLGDLESAVACHRKAAELNPDDADTRYNLGESFKVQGQLQAAIESYERALELAPDHVSALGGLVHLRQHVCRWEGMEKLWQRVREKIAGGAGGKISPFSTFSMPTSAAEQLACARAWARQELAPLPAARGEPRFDFSRPRSRERIRVGYLSWGFHRHATAHLTAELFELNDRKRFEVFAYAYGPEDNSAIRARVRKACEHFVDVSQESYFATAQRIYGDGVDILVDLTGYTLGTRPQILALRPAPIQVNWLGYPGTLGTDCVDFIVADPFIIPEGQERFYAEKVIRLPDCYQVNDRRREVGERVPSREECGLPGSGIVFCCFNQAYKILPEMFGAWMRILQAVPGSVLWLAEANPWAAGHLRREAAARGVAGERLVFAPRKPLGEYMVQYRIADFALDTFPYTSHTTAADALWMGCPLATCAGETFASRVAGSVLASAGMRELVTDNLGDYERMVIELAGSPQRLQDLRRRLRETRDSCALFDTPGFVKHLEAAYEEMMKAYAKKNVSA